MNITRRTVLKSAAGFGGLGALAWVGKGSLADADPFTSDWASLKQNRCPGPPGPMRFRREPQAFVVDLPAKKPCDHAYVLKIILSA